MRYSLLAPGKRLRPKLVIVAGEACGGRDGQALAAACAVEMIHTYALIHAHLPAMDNDDLRRGRPTCHKQFGWALAIRAGDGLLTLAFGVLAENYPPATAAGCCRELARGAAGMVGGQVEDLAWENSTPSRPPTLEALDNIHARKTGALFRACLRLGAWTAQGENPAGTDSDIIDKLDQYGRCFGMVFQITDDLLDVEGTPQETGKGVGKDAARGKLTFPGFVGVEESRRRDRPLCHDGEEGPRPLASRGDRLCA